MDPCCLSVPGFASGWTTTMELGWNMFPWIRCSFFPVLLCTLLSCRCSWSDIHNVSSNTARSKGPPGGIKRDEKNQISQSVSRWKLLYSILWRQGYWSKRDNTSLTYLVSQENPSIWTIQGSGLHHTPHLVAPEQTILCEIDGQAAWWCKVGASNDDTVFTFQRGCFHNGLHA